MKPEMFLNNHGVTIIHPAPPLHHVSIDRLVHLLCATCAGTTQRTSPPEATMLDLTTQGHFRQNNPGLEPPAALPAEVGTHMEEFPITFCHCCLISFVKQENSINRVKRRRWKT